MKFDVVIGNPPFQDGSKGGGQNKIYNQFCKKSINLLKDVGKIYFITPISVLKNSKRFTIIGIDGLKIVDFTSNRFFNEGIKLCSWFIDNTYNGDVKIIHNDGTDCQSKDELIFDYSEIDKKFTKIYSSLRSVTNVVSNRMFKHNAIDMSKCRSNVKSEVFKYPIYKLNSDGTSTLCQYNSVEPKLYGKKTFTISITKKFDESMTVIDDLDYDMTHVSIQIDNDEQVVNIKSFIFSDYFKEIAQHWKNLNGYGWNYALIYLPPFDKTKKWTNEEVKQFIESFVD